MSNYRLSCSCGNSTSVSASQAGQTVTCSCGAPLEVPTLRGLRELPRDDANARRQRSPWENRQRAVFTLALISLAAISMGAYLWTKVPPLPRQVSPGEIKAAFADGKPDAVYAMYEELQKGIGVRVVTLIQDQRDFMLFGVEIALGIGLATLIAAVMITLRGRKRAV